MTAIGIVLRITGGLCLFLYGMKVMGDGIQQAAGDRLQRVLGLMTGNRLAGVITGIAVTAIIQSSSATTVMVVS
ncbi:MAG: Na/Pi symporter, partial [Treponema sp.]|nr:Na/Pi symporter [Treponema sp.]